MKKLIAVALICAASLANAYASDIEDRAAALTKASPDKAFNLMMVPSADGFFANKMVVVSLKSGAESNAVKDIVALLQQPAPANLAVSSHNDDVTVATLERAFDSLKGKSVTPQELAYVGEADAGAALTAKAAELGIKLVVVPLR